MAALSKKGKKELIKALQAEEGVELADDASEEQIIAALPDLSQEGLDELSGPVKKWVEQNDVEDEDEEEEAEDEDEEEEAEDEDEEAEDEAPAKSKKSSKKKSSKAPAKSSKSSKKKSSKAPAKSSKSSKKKSGGRRVSDDKGWRANKKDEDGVSTEIRSSAGVVEKFREIVVKMRLNGEERDFKKAIDKLQKTHPQVSAGTVRSLHSIYHSCMDMIEKQTKKSMTDFK